MPAQVLYELELTPHLVLISTSPRRLLKDDPFKRFEISGAEGSDEEEYQLCIIIGWFLATKNQIMKYAQFYLDQDFDVLFSSSTANQLFRPISSPKNTSLDILDFLDNNRHYGPILIHSFSVGAMVWGYLLQYVNQNPAKYEFLFDRILGQVWDSPFMNTETLPKVASSTAFPHNFVLRKITKSYLKYLMKKRVRGSTFCRYAAKGFLRLNIITQFLIFTSENDSTSLCSDVAECAEQWQFEGSIVYWKIWKRSTYVCHIRDHPEEYTTLLKDFLESIYVLKYPDRFKIIPNKTEEVEAVESETSSV